MTRRRTGIDFALSARATPRQARITRAVRASLVQSGRSTLDDLSSQVPADQPRLAVSSFIPRGRSVRCDLSRIPPPSSLPLSPSVPVLPPLPGSLASLHSVLSLFRELSWVPRVGRGRTRARAHTQECRAGRERRELGGTERSEAETGASRNKASEAEARASDRRAARGLVLRQRARVVADRAWRVEGPRSAAAWRPSNRAACAASAASTLASRSTSSTRARITFGKSTPCYRSWYVITLSLSLPLSLALSRSSGRSHTYARSFLRALFSSSCSFSFASSFPPSAPLARLPFSTREGTRPRASLASPALSLPLHDGGIGRNPPTPSPLPPRPPCYETRSLFSSVARAFLRFLLSPPPPLVFDAPVCLYISPRNAVKMK